MFPPLPHLEREERERAEREEREREGERERERERRTAIQTTIKRSHSDPFRSRAQETNNF